MDRRGEKKAVLIAGGYHSPNLKSLLKAKNISYVSITPQVFHETNHAKYERLLLSQDLDKLPSASVSDIHSVSLVSSPDKIAVLYARMRITSALPLLRAAKRRGWRGIL